jgi:hypothetical protein
MKLRILLYLLPLAATVLSQCKQVGLRPWLPVLGLAVGVAAEIAQNSK